MARGVTIDRWLWFQRDIRNESDLNEFLSGNFNIARTTINVCRARTDNETLESFLVYGQCDSQFRVAHRQLQYIIDRLTADDNILLKVLTEEAWDFCRRLIPHPFIDDNIYIFFPLAVGPNGDPAKVMPMNGTNIVGYSVVGGFDEDYGDELGYTETQLNHFVSIARKHHLKVYQFDALHFSQMTGPIPNELPDSILFNLKFNNTDLEKEMNKTFLQIFIKSYHAEGGHIYYSLEKNLSFELDPRDDVLISISGRNPPPKVPQTDYPRLVFSTTSELKTIHHVIFFFLASLTTFSFLMLS